RVVEAQTARAAAFRMKLNAYHIAVTDCRAKRDTGVRRQSKSARWVTGHYVIRMDEIHEQGIGREGVRPVRIGRSRTVHAIPADMRDLDGIARCRPPRKAHNAALQQAQTAMQPEFRTLIEEQLHSEADADDWCAGRSGGFDGAGETTRLERCHCD